MGFFVTHQSDRVVYRSWETAQPSGAKFRIAVLKLDHVGDFWMSLGALRELRQRFASAHITLVVGSWNIDTARQFELADDYVAFDFFSRNPKLGKKRKPAEEIRNVLKGEFDLAIDMRVPDETRQVLIAIPARHRAAIADRYRMPEIDIAIQPFKLRLRRGFLYKLAQKIGLSNKAPRRWFDRDADRQQLGIQHVADILHFLVSKTATYFDNPTQRSIPPPSGETASGPIVVAPFSNSDLRDWPIENYREVVATLSKKDKVILVGRSESLPALESVADAARKRGAGNVEIAADLTEHEFNQLLASSALVVSNNSGAGHVAAQLGRPTIGIFTASHLPELWGFQGPFVSMLMSTVECRGCGLDAVRRCPNDVMCKTDITPDHVLAEISALLNRTKSLDAMAA
ncbi:glycosyltransferase family 9 protein [Kaistia granuli]|uniref:glycosyltransferase family 9 protein n=1 Tax=Kaistia granuli TaxID=363259 RepID=UPI0009FE63C9|nr:glycosyltransferase family 9 protein [Kaistia granuli]